MQGFIVYVDLESVCPRLFIVIDACSKFKLLSYIRLKLLSISEAPFNLSNSLLVL